MLTTPEKITDKITSFCQSISTEKPVFVAIDATLQGRVSDCFENVKVIVAQHQGMTIYGWRIWEWPNKFLEAELHAVWRNNDGAYIDVTPNSEGENRILFLPDPRVSYSGRYTPSRQISLAEDFAVSEYIKACQELFTFSEHHFVDYGDDNVGLEINAQEQQEYARLKLAVAHWVGKISIDGCHDGK